MPLARVQVSQCVRLLYVFVKGRGGQFLIRVQGRFKKVKLRSGHKGHKEILTVTEREECPEIIVQHPVVMPSSEHLKASSDF